MNSFNNDEYENCLLGILLLDNSLIDIVSGRLTTDCFYNLKARKIYNAILTLKKSNNAVNYVTLSNTLTNCDVNYITSLTDNIPSASNWEFYVTKIREMYLARCVRQELSESLGGITPENINNAIHNLQTKLTSFMQYGDSGVDLKNMCVEIPEEIKAAYKSQKRYIGFESGLEQLDDILDGWQTSCTYVIGARPSIGKTAFALTIARKLCSQNVPVTLFSLEMSAKQDFYRMLASESKLPLSFLKKGTCMASKQGMLKLINGCNRLFEYNMNIIDIGANYEQELYSRIRYEATVKGKKVFIIDHLGLIIPSKSSSNHYLDVGRITATLHALSKELDICIIELVQMNREAEGKKPSMNLIRESGNIEQDADVIMFLYRERDLEENKIPTQVIVEKNRDGKTGYANFIFDKPTQDFIEDKGTRNDEIAEAPDLTENKTNKEVEVEEYGLF